MEKIICKWLFSSNSTWWPMSKLIDKRNFENHSKLGGRTCPKISWSKKIMSLNMRLNRKWEVQQILNLMPTLYERILWANNIDGHVSAFTNRRQKSAMVQHFDFKLGKLTKTFYITRWYYHGKIILSLPPIPVPSRNIYPQKNHLIRKCQKQISHKCNYKMTKIHFGSYSFGFAPSVVLGSEMTGTYFLIL